MSRCLKIQVEIGLVNTQVNKLSSLFSSKLFWEPSEKFWSRFQNCLGEVDAKELEGCMCNGNSGVMLGFICLHGSCNHC